MVSQASSQLRESGVLLPPPAAAAFLAERGCQTAPKTLAKLRCVGGGPEFRRFGRKIVYETSALLKWAEARISPPLRNTSTRA